METLGFADIVGPIMVGPSSSHTAGALRIARMARSLLAAAPARAEFTLYGSFAHTQSGHGTDKALVAGLLGLAPDDLGVRDSFERAHAAGLAFSFACDREAGVEHPNTVDARIVVTNDDGTYRGLITTRMIAERYIAATDVLEEGGANEMAVAGDLIASLGQKVSDITETDVLELDKDGLLKEAVEDLMASALREAVVLDDDGFAIGIVTRSDVAVHPRRKVVLVDHNETRQAANGIEEAEVVEIVDHHRIADVMTANPIKFLNLPVGSTATIVAMEFRRHCVEMPPAIASVLLSAVMTDTVILKSPTATYVDHEIVDFLADVAGVDPTAFGLAVFRCRGGEDNMPVAKLVGADSKEFQLGDSTVLIAQHETVDLPAVMKREDEIRAYMRRLREDRGYEFVLLMVTDILAEGSQFLCEGNLRTVNRVFNIDCSAEGGTWMPGVLSRKKQVAAKILGA